MTTDDLGTCTYVAEKDDPSNWHGEGPDDWMLDADSWSCPHDVLDHEEVNREYCAFHLDPKYVPNDVDEAERFVRTVNEESDSDDEEVARRKKEFVGATFGEFEVRDGTTLAAGDEFPIRLDHATSRKGFIVNDGTVQHDFSAKTACFEGRCSFNGTRFTHRVSFTSAEFTGGAWFWGATFSGSERISFKDVKFTGGDIQFRAATITGAVSFADTEFSGDGGVSFEDTVFTGSGNVLFDGAEFTGTVSFTDTEFEGDGIVSFYDSSFTSDGEVSFRGTRFTNDGNVSFRDSEFTVPTVELFRNVTFTDSVDLGISCFPGTISFVGARFSGCALELTKAGGMDFRRANFTDSDLRNSDFSGANLEETLFSRANLYNADFTGAKLDGAVFGNARINQGTDFGEEIDHRVPYDPTDSQDVETRFDSTKRTVQRYLPLRPSQNTNVRTDDDESVNGTQTPSNDNRGVELLSAARAYHNLERIGRENSLPKLQRIGFVRRQEMHRLRYAEEAATADSGAWKLWAKWLRASVARLTLLYGESPWRVIAVSLGAILFCGALYPLGGFRAGDASDAEVIRATSFGEWVSLLPDGVYFSTLTFTTLGFGDFQPAGWGRFVATGETALGATLLALLVFVLGRRAAR